MRHKNRRNFRKRAKLFTTLTTFSYQKSLINQGLSSKVVEEFYPVRLPASDKGTALYYFHLFYF